MSLRPVNMEFLYGTSFLSQSPEAYERLITDAMRGDATLFTRDDEVEAQWRIIDPGSVCRGGGGGAPPPPAPPRPRAQPRRRGRPRVARRDREPPGARRPLPRLAHRALRAGLAPVDDR